MFSATRKTSVEASDVQTDEDCEELAEDGFSFSADIFEKRTRRDRPSGKPPPSPKSPYLSSLNVNPRRAAVAAWRLPRASLGDAGGETVGDGGSARLASLSNGHDLSQTLRSERDVTPELLKNTLSMRKHKQLHSASNGFVSGPGDFREKEDMYDEIIRLKKSLQAQKSDNRQLKVKLRRLEEDNAKREKQIEELLDPTKGSEYTRSLVDKKKEGSVVVNGLKQRILKLEQQCREKENALSKLQSELRTTNLEELKISVQSYFEEIQRLRMLLEAAEKSSRAESKCSQRQQKALSSTVHRLSESLKQLQQENATLREELDTDGPAGGLKGYREWSKQRLLRRLLEVEKRPEDRGRHAQSAKSRGRLDREVQATPAEILGFATATEAAVSVGTLTEGGDEVSEMRERLGQWEKERAELQERLSSKEDEARQLRTDREELERDAERWKAEQTRERDEERRRHEQELEQLRVRIQSLEYDKVQRLQAEPSPLSATGREDGPGAPGPKGDGGEDLRKDAEKKRSEKRRSEEREEAARILQTKWREHRRRDVVMLQSAMRGHLLRRSQLDHLPRDAHAKDSRASVPIHVATVISPSLLFEPAEATRGSGAEVDAAALTTIQAAFRGHLARCRLATESSGISPPPPTGNSLAPRRARSSGTGAASLHHGNSKQGDEEEPWPVSASRTTPTTDQTEPHCIAETGGAAAVDSDDSDDIIVSPSRPLRSREVLLS